MRLQLLLFCILPLPIAACNQNTFVDENPTPRTSHSKFRVTVKYGWPEKEPIYEISAITKIRKPFCEQIKQEGKSVITLSGIVLPPECGKYPVVYFISVWSQDQDHPNSGNGMVDLELGIPCSWSTVICGSCQTPYTVTIEKIEETEIVEQEFRG